MANPDHLRQLCEGARGWNAWRDSNPDVVPDLAGAALALGQRQFGPSNGGPINLRGANLERATLRHATLIEADLEGASLKAADLAYARLSGAKLGGADLTGALLDQADFSEASCEAATIAGTNLATVGNLTQSQVEGMTGDRQTVLPPDLQSPTFWRARPQEAKQSTASTPAAEPELELGASEAFDGQAGQESAAKIAPLSANPSKADLFGLLSLEPTATADEIRKAYRRLAKVYHPDLNPGDEAAAQRFKAIDEAHRILLAPPVETAHRPPSPFYRSWGAVAALFLLMLGAPSAGLYWFMQVPVTVPSPQLAEDIKSVPVQSLANRPVSRVEPITQPQRSAEMPPPAGPQLEEKIAGSVLGAAPSAAIPLNSLPSEPPAPAGPSGESAITQADPAKSVPAEEQPVPPVQPIELATPAAPPVTPPEQVALPSVPAASDNAATSPAANAENAVPDGRLPSQPAQAESTRAPAVEVASPSTPAAVPDRGSMSQAANAENTVLGGGSVPSQPAQAEPPPAPAPEVTSPATTASTTPVDAPAEKGTARVDEASEPAPAERLAAHSLPTQLSPLIAPRRSVRLAPTEARPASSSDTSEVEARDGRPDQASETAPEPGPTPAPPAAADDSAPRSTASVEDSATFDTLALQLPERRPNDIARTQLENTFSNLRLLKERRLWAASKGHRREGLEAYLRAFPKGVYAGLARQRLAALKPQPSIATAQRDHRDRGRANEAPAKPIEPGGGNIALAEPQKVPAAPPSARESSRVRWPSSDDPFGDRLPGAR